MSNNHAAALSALAERILSGVQQVIDEAESETRPLELDPFRSRLFELFVTAHGAGYVDEDAQDDLTADGLCRLLAERWGLREAARTSAAAQTQLPGDEVSKMRLLWSVMRMWMEWTYAWERWPEFHTADSAES